MSLVTEFKNNHCLYWLVNICSFVAECEVIIHRPKLDFLRSPVGVTVSASLEPGKRGQGGGGQQIARINIASSTVRIGERVAGVSV